METKNLAELYDLAPLEWRPIADRLATALTQAPGTGGPVSAPSAGPPPWRVYRMRVTSATALQTVEPGGATRWTFS
jgi:hypothetical protein